MNYYHGLICLLSQSCLSFLLDSGGFLWHTSLSDFLISLPELKSLIHDTLVITELSFLQKFLVHWNSTYIILTPLSGLCVGVGGIQLNSEDVLPSRFILLQFPCFRRAFSTVLRIPRRRIPNRSVAIHWNQDVACVLLFKFTKTILLSKDHDHFFLPNWCRLTLHFVSHLPTELFHLQDT